MRFDSKEGLLCVSGCHAMIVSTAKTVPPSRDFPMLFAIS